MGKGRALHVGSGGQALPFYLEGYDETGLDINPKIPADIHASVTDMGEIGQFDLVYSSHCLEHLFPWEVEQALSECFRVLVPGGKLLLLVPDLEDVKPTADVLFDADCGPVTGLDMYYGHTASIKTSPWMAHHTGFLQESLTTAISKAGFTGVIVNRIPKYNLMGGGIKQ